MNNQTRQQLAAQGAGAATRRAGHKAAEAQYGGPGPVNQSRPLADPQNQTSTSLHSLNAVARIIVGVITDNTAVGNVYRLQLEQVTQPVVAFFGPRTSIGSFGARELTTLQVGTMVSCLYHPQMPYAQIISVYTPPGTNPDKNQHSVIHGASRNRVDEAHKRPLRMENGGSIPAMLAGRPFDATMCGEAGWITETGIKIFIDSFMALMGVDEGCQLSFHYHDMLCRLAGQQLQIWTSVRETESLNDQDEAQDWTGYAMYPWEQMGLEARADPTTIKTPQEWQIDEPYYSKMEPKDDHMMPWHREREFHGYLGQGGMRCVIAPPVEFSNDGDLGTADKETLEEGASAEFTSYRGGNGDGVEDAMHPGLFHQFVTADGRLVTQSVKGLSFIKRGAIMLPVRRQRPEAPDGDNPENYKFSGVLGEGEEHKITGDIETSGTNKSMNRAAGVLDMHAYFCNYAGVHPFFYHAEDYKLYEESEAQWVDAESASVPDYNKLSSEAYLDAEDYKKTWKVDHRYGEQQFYTLSSGIEMLDDGGIMIADGFGSAIRMVGGSIDLSAAGDIWMKAGRNTNVWAGRDVIVRAKHSADITATEQDVRIKAEKNLFVLGGNGGDGGVLIESRGTGAELDFEECGEKAKMNGLILRAKDSQLVAWASDIYFRTGGAGTPAGPIVLDAGKGEAPIIAYGQSIQHYVSEGAFWHFNTVEGSVDGPSAGLTATTSAFPGDVCIDGTLTVNGHGTFNGSLRATGSVAAATGSPFIGALASEALQAAESQISKCQELIETTLPQETGQKVFDTALEEAYYAAKKPGNDDVILKAEVSLRVQQDYKTEKFELYEDRWQQLGRLAGSPGEPWQEKPVVCQGDDTYPYPGKEAFVSGQRFFQQDLEIFDAKAGRSKDRGSQPNLAAAYTDPKFSEPKPTSLNNYTVIPRN